MKSKSHFTHRFRSYMAICVILFSLFTCVEKVSTIDELAYEINLQHFDHLYKEVVIDSSAMAIVHIYSEHPDYAYAIEPAEGYTCVDDVARSVVMLCAYLDLNNDPDRYAQLEKLLEFLLFMQHDNGYFNNFLWSDGTVNETYRTSVAELNWWSLRAFWALEVALKKVQHHQQMVNRIQNATEALYQNIITDLYTNDLQTITSDGYTLPAWLPHQFAADQAALLIIALEHYYHRTDDTQALQLIDHLAQGILLMQRGDESHFPHYALMSWQNSWHAWGNSQAHALLRASTLLDNQPYQQAALNEINNFYNFLSDNDFLESFKLLMRSNGEAKPESSQYPQIAYGMRPMIWAAVEAYEQTGDIDYWNQATALLSWFSGQNPANMAMYDPLSGRCYDGILSPNQINHNSGAESTIECLLSILKLKIKTTTDE